MTDSAKLALPFIAEAQAGKYLTHNEALRVLDAIVQGAALDKDLSTPPGSPANGNTYIVGAAATGDWTGQENKIAYYYNATWYFITPREGWLFHLDDENEFYKYTGAAWAIFTTTVASINDITDVTITSPADGEVLTYSSGSWINAAAGGGGAGSSLVSALLDVGNLPGAAQGFSLAYNEDRGGHNKYNGAYLHRRNFDYNSVSKLVTGIGTGYGAYLTADGTMLFVVDNDTDTIERYDFGTAFDISTIGTTAAKSFSHSTESTAANSVTFSPDGLNMYLFDATSPFAVYEYALSTAWDPESASVTTSFAWGSPPFPTAGAWSPDGTFMLTMWGDNLYKYDASTAFDVSSLTLDESIDGSALYGWPTGTVYFMTVFEDNEPDNEGGVRCIFGSGTSNSGFFEFSLDSTLDISTGLTYHGNFLPFAEIGAHLSTGLFFDTAGTTAIFHRSDGTLFEYTFTNREPGWGAQAEPVLIVEDRKADTTGGGGFTSGAWQTRELRTEVLNNLRYGSGGLSRELPYDGENAEGIAVGDKCYDNTSGAHATVINKTDAGATGTLRLVNVSGTYGDNNVIYNYEWPLGSALVNNLSPTDTATGTNFSDQIALEAGTYEVEAEAVAYAVDGHQVKLRDTTGAADLVIGDIADAPTGVMSRSRLHGTFTLSATSLIELQHRCETTNGTDGFGRPLSFGVGEVYARVKIKRIG